MHFYHNNNNSNNNTDNNINNNKHRNYSDRVFHLKVNFLFTAISVIMFLVTRKKHIFYYFDIHRKNLGSKWPGHIFEKPAQKPDAGREVLLLIKAEVTFNNFKPKNLLRIADIPKYHWWK
jgi:hypothetical protein